MTATCNGFYAFQGRKTRIPAESLINLEKLNRILFKNHKVTNLEMETAIIYGLSDFLGHNAISLNAILANRVSNLYSEKPNEIIDSLDFNYVNNVAKKILDEKELYFLSVGNPK